VPLINSDFSNSVEVAFVAIALPKSEPRVVAIAMVRELTINAFIFLFVKSSVPLFGKTEKNPELSPFGKVKFG
jgi:hypothetical protein